LETAESNFEPEGRGLRATLRVAKPSQPKAARESLPARHAQPTEIAELDLASEASASSPSRRTT